MAKSETHTILTLYKEGNISLNKAEQALKKVYVDDIGFAQVDRLREVRKNFPEVIYGAGKTTEQIVAITEKILDHSGRILITRVGEDVHQAVKKSFSGLKYNRAGRCVYYEGTPAEKKKYRLRKGHVLVICAGTSDLPVAEEAAVTARVTGCRVNTVYDIGVAGIHRLLSRGEELKKASVVICVAGMEGALASVVGGMVNCPVIAVPTSIGYGASFKGVAALLSMLNSCAPGVSVVNIDNGFGAGFAAFQILKLLQ